MEVYGSIVDNCDGNVITIDGFTLSSYLSDHLFICLTQGLQGPPFYGISPFNGRIAVILLY